MSRQLISAMALAAAFLGFTAGANAEVLFSTLADGDAFNPDSGFTVGGDVPNHQIVGAMFSPSSTNTMGTIDLAMGYFWGVNSVNVQLRSDSEGLPGGLIESYTITNLPDGYSGLVHAYSAGQPTLTAGNLYWVTVSAADADSAALWNDALNPIYGTVATSTDEGATWATSNWLPAFRIESDVLPEPSTFVLLGMGVIGLFFHVWRRR